MRYRPKIKSKRIRYAGNDFRSITEAKWAVFFDLLSITYKYESEYSEVEAGCKVVWYKPDFHLPELHKYIEIKPKKPEGIETIKASGWCEDMGLIVVLFELNPPKENTESGWMFKFTEYFKKATLIKNVWWCECPRCGKIDLCEFGEVECGCFSLKELNQINIKEEKGEKFYPSFEHTPRLLDAYKIAKYYKFKTQNRAHPIPYNRTIWQHDDMVGKT